MSVRKVVLIVLLVNLAFLVALGGLYWAQSARAQAGGQPQGAATGSQPLGIVGQYMNYQGVVYDDAGNPLEGSHDLTFILYSCSAVPQPTCSEVWSDTEDAFDLVHGLFNVKLGPLDSTLFEPRFLLPGWHLELGTKIDGGLEIAPRVALNTTVPWAFTSLYTESMPEPDYDSGWVESAGGVLCGTYEVQHNLGGSTDDYVVTLDCRRDDGWGTYNCLREGGMDASWLDLTTTDVAVDPCWTTQDPLDFRLRIWVTR
jgi:hypothetical protein